VLGEAGSMSNGVSVVTVVRAVEVYWVTVLRMLVVEMLRVTELVVRVLRIAEVAVAVAVAGRDESGVVLSG
jgi:hypothetical protein